MIFYEELYKEKLEKGLSGTRAVAKPIIWEGVYSYIRVLTDRFLLKTIVSTVCEHEYNNIDTLNYRV
jgi:hypothetical protein